MLLSSLIKTIYWFLQDFHKQPIPLTMSREYLPTCDTFVRTPRVHESCNYCVSLGISKSSNLKGHQTISILLFVSFTFLFSIFLYVLLFQIFLVITKVQFVPQKNTKFYFQLLINFVLLCPINIYVIGNTYIYICFILTF
jgi:hypothetical protein